MHIQHADAVIIMPVFGIFIEIFNIMSSCFVQCQTLQVCAIAVIRCAHRVQYSGDPEFFSGWGHWT